MLSGRQQAGYSTIEVNKTSLPEKLDDDLIIHIEKIHKEKIAPKIVKYDYLRVGNKERIYGKLEENVFYAIIYDPDKKVITN